LPKFKQAAARSLCDSWASCYVLIATSRAITLLSARAASLRK